MGLFDRRKDAASPGKDQTVPSPPAPEPAEVVAPETQPVSPEEPAPEEPTGEPTAESTPVEPTAESTPGEPAEPPSPTAEPTTRHVHTVAAGESLADLADRYGVPAEEIARQNHLSPTDRIHPGQVFVVTAP